MMSDYEPASRDNLPPGCFEDDPRAPWNEPVPRGTCGECAHLLDGCCDYGICELEFEEAFDEAKPKTQWKAALWARDWIADRYRDGQEVACEQFKP